MADAPDRISITICGDGGCGKSSITLRLVRSQWIHEYDPTIEDSYSVTRTIDGLPYFLSITDTAGQEEYRGLWTASNLKSDAFLLVYDITNVSSLGALDDFMELINIEAEQRVEDNQRLLKELGDNAQGLDVGMPPPIKIVAGNKCDLKEGRVIGAREGLEYARKHGCGFMETSAREMVNIEETFALLVRRVVEARRLHYQRGASATHAPQPLGPSVEKNSDVATHEAVNSDPPKVKPPRQSFLGMFKKGEKPLYQEAAPKSSGPEKSLHTPRPSIWRRLCCRG
ncbi:ras-domain-containing protein [Aspergillus steynii IBT 23096]|uniref:Ras-domain-containing protein n=1 Tax=Aspergillus steynii IBT 23096 TaxID=1392250 RepID=A0A2I2GFR3_9EURO|nr:ras-domain-containing protein [Aspergillus steynii IBT 23096]PLB51724.1 ras-domain-containing protein [Aspergillus steynii IBT 23096]